MTACGSTSSSRSAIQDCSEMKATRTRLVAFGDSHTFGKQSRIGFCRYSYAYDMAFKLDLNMINRAIGGSTLLDPSTVGPSQYDMITTTVFQPTDLVVFQIGFNDVARYGDDSVALNRFHSSLSSALLSMSAQVSHIYLATPLPMIDYSFTKGSPASYDLYVQAIKSAASGIPNLTLLETKTLFTLKPEYVLDRIHISSSAHEKLGDAYIDYIKTH